MRRRTEHSGEWAPPPPGSAPSPRAHKVAFPESEGRGRVAHPRREESDEWRIRVKVRRKTGATLSRGTGISNGKGLSRVQAAALPG